MPASRFAPPSPPVSPDPASSASSPVDRPLASWHFNGVLRTYQADILTRVDASGVHEHLHIVAPPGAGKTLVGLLLAMRNGRRAVVLAPTVIIREQWVGEAATLAPDGGAISQDPEAPSDLTALTYQMISVVDGSNAFEDAARRQWISELVEGGRPEDDAHEWLESLERDNAEAFRKGIRRRGTHLRKSAVREDPEAIAHILHPHAVRLLDRLVQAGVRTVILDECHHLLDHWAYVVRYLCEKIRQSGDTPLVIGLTATLPSPEDDEYSNYSTLLGDVDFEIPTPAVIREGNLAPSRAAVWFTSPTPVELDFLTGHDRDLDDVVRTMLGSPEGLDFVRSILQPVLPTFDDEPGQLTDQPSSTSPAASPQTGLAQAFTTDFHLAWSCSTVFAALAPGDPLVWILPAGTREKPALDDLLVVLARYALDRLLADPTRHEDWQRVKNVLEDFGYHLTDHGLRRGRNPIENLLATSASKDAAAIEILDTEFASPEGPRVRAVVVTDFARHGNGRSDAGGSGGAVRCFDAIARATSLAFANPVLITSADVRTPTDVAERVARALSGCLGLDVSSRPRADNPAVSDLLCGASSAAVLGALGELMTQGIVRVIVGTRGLLGEGWDCPALNTLIDLTAVATSSSTQQLHGRALRLDPAWPQKVAHTWTVSCLLPERLTLDDRAELRRLLRKHVHLWGVDLDSKREIVSGVAHALTSSQLGQLAEHATVTSGGSTATPNAGTRVDELNLMTYQALEPRAQTYQRWGIGQPMVDQEAEATLLPAAGPQVPDFVSAPTMIGVGALIAAWVGAVGWISLAALRAGGPVVLAVALVIMIVGSARPLARWIRELGRWVRQRAQPRRFYVGATLAIVDVLSDAGVIPRFTGANIAVSACGDAESSADGSMDRTAWAWSVGVTGGSTEDRRLVVDQLTELFGPVRRPRFLLRVGGASMSGTGVLAWLDRVLPRRSCLPVPARIAKRRQDAESFARAWQREVGPCELIEITGVEAIDILTQARHDGPEPTGFEQRYRMWS